MPVDAEDITVGNSGASIDIRDDFTAHSTDRLTFSVKIIVLYSRTACRSCSVSPTQVRSRAGDLTCIFRPRIQIRLAISLSSSFSTSCQISSQPFCFGSISLTCNGHPMAWSQSETTACDKIHWASIPWFIAISQNEVAPNRAREGATRHEKNRG